MKNERKMFVDHIIAKSIYIWSTFVVTKDIDKREQEPQELRNWAYEVNLGNK